jgi:hypothetical protein
LITAAAAYPWLLQDVGWTAVLACLVCALDWRRKFIRETEGDKGKVTTLTGLVFLAFLAYAVVIASPVISLISHSKVQVVASSVPEIPTSADSGELAYLDGTLEITHTVPNPGLNVFYLPTDFSVSNEIRQAFPSAYSNPIASKPALFRIRLRNDGEKPWIRYAVKVIIHYEMRSAFPVDRKRWDVIPHVDETLTLSNCREDDSFSELPPLAPNDQPRSIAIINMSGAYAAIEIPDQLTATVRGSDTPIPVNVTLGGRHLEAGNARTTVLPPNREGQGTFIR